MSYITPEDMRKLRASGIVAFPGDPPLPSRKVVMGHVSYAPQQPIAAPSDALKQFDAAFGALAISDALEALAVAMEAERDAVLTQFSQTTASHGGIRAGFNRAIEMTRAAKK